MELYYVATPSKIISKAYSLKSRVSIIVSVTTYNILSPSILHSRIRYLHRLALSLPAYIISMYIYVNTMNLCPYRKYNLKEVNFLLLRERSTFYAW